MAMTENRCPVGLDCPACSLDCASAGQALEVIAIDDEAARIQAMRFGMAEGATVRCVSKIPAGPVILSAGRQEIAVGRALAKRILVQPQADA
jgi:ferrous iron transport protein A